ncbi:MAG: gamma-glutamyltransferase [Desulfovibrionaceae bacterium]|nr:gamma-glutamyltransferase [Desulfovibrionaceae bacterium]
MPTPARFTHGLVTSPNYLATLAGVDILRRGGNALDASLATAATLACVYPHMCTLGGDGFWLIYAKSKGRLLGLNASGRSGKKATISAYENLGYTDMPKRGYLAANTVPGLVSGFEAVHTFSQKELNSKISWANLFESARLYARDGFPVSASLAKWSKKYFEANKLAPAQNPLSEELAKVFFPGYSPLKVGQIFCQPDLAKSIERLMDYGWADFYEGELASQIIGDIEEHGGFLGRDDFLSHKANWVEPISINYRGYTAANLPPNTQGLASLVILNILNNFHLTKYAEGSSDYYHLLIEATKEAFLDRDTYLSDPEVVDIPVKELLSVKHGQAQAARINLKLAQKDLGPLDPHGDTVYVGCVDRDGNAVSMIQSIYYDFGSAVVPKNTGIILQNRGCYFSLDPKHVNALCPEKRTFHTLNPAMLLEDGRPYLIYGTMGGEGQPQTQAQLVTRILDYHLDVAQAIDRPRFLYGRSWGNQTNKVFLEARIPKSVGQDLGSRGHPIEYLADYEDLMGMAGLILCKQDLFEGSNDPRSDGLALGF